MSSSLTTDICLEVEVEYTCVSKGRPESGPTYSCAGEPAEPPEFEIDRVMYNGTDIKSSLSDDLLEDLREQVAEDYANQEPDYEDRDDDDY
jgi:hypothetical protein